MNRLWMIAVVAALALAVGLGGMALAQNAGDTPGSTPGSVSVNIPNQQTGIWVTGVGKVTLAPDVAILQVGVQSQALTVAEAQSQAAEAMDKVMKALRDGGVASKDIQTRYFSIERVTRWDDKTQTEVVLGYRVANSVTAKIRTLDKVGDIIDAVAVAGGDLTRINGISFTIDDPTEAAKEARDKAMADAKAKAQQLASNGGVSLGKPTYISENSYVPYSPSYPMPIAADGRTEVKTPISPGEMDITVNVQVAYAIN